jgi:hypothetical protein
MENAGIFYGNLVYFMAIWYVVVIWYILWPFGKVVVIWYIFPPFGILCQEKSATLTRYTNIVCETHSLSVTNKIQPGNETVNQGCNICTRV